jgi:DNA-binding FadR family transcriptional regulator
MDTEVVIEKYMGEDRKLHLLIGRAAHNSVLFTVFSGVNLMMNEAHWKTLKTRAISKKGNISKYHKNHTVIVKAICSGEPNVARKEMRKHIADLKKDLFDVYPLVEKARIHREKRMVSKRCQRRDSGSGDSFRQAPQS